MYLIDYLNRIMLEYGVFDTEADAERWIETHVENVDRRGWYTVIHVPVNRDNTEIMVPFNMYTRYVCQK